jgi:hypothetical protein
MALNIQEVLDEVVTISEQVAASQGATDGSRTLGKALERGGNLVSDNAELLADKSGDSIEEIFAFAELHARYAALVLPASATVSWKSPDVQENIKKLEAAVTLDMLSDSQVVLFENAISILKVGGGSRGPRTDAETIEGKATRVLILVDGEKVADLGGNTVQSPGNLTARLLKLTDTVKDSDEHKALKVYSANACKGETVEIPGTTITLVPFEPED